MIVPPSPPLHSIIPSEVYPLGLKWWLGVPIVCADSDGVECPGCLKPVDLYGDHLLCCPRNNFNLRHAAVQEALANVFTASGQGFTREVTLPGQVDAELRPADLLLSSWQSGKPMAVDITVSHSWQHWERLVVSREHWRSFLPRKEGAKRLKYDIPCQEAGWSFTPMAFGTWGGQGPEAAKLLQRAAAWQEGDLRAGRQDVIRCAVGLALMRQVWWLLGSQNFLPVARRGARS